MTHTPGSWEVGGPYPSVTVCNIVEVGEEGEHWEIITWLWQDIKREASDEIKANAHLIAAAPDLLEACERMFRSLAAFLDYVDREDTHHYYAPKAALELGRAAIAKARGETP